MKKTPQAFSKIQSTDSKDQEHVRQLRAMAQALGGGERAREFAEMLTRLKYDLPLDDPPEPDAASKAGSGAPAANGNGASPGKAETADAAAATFPGQTPTQSN